MSCVSVNYRTSADELSPYFAVVLELTVIAFNNFFLKVCGGWRGRGKGGGKYASSWFLMFRQSHRGLVRNIFS